MTSNRRSAHDVHRTLTNCSPPRRDRLTFLPAKFAQYRLFEYAVADREIKKNLQNRKRGIATNQRLSYDNQHIGPCGLCAVLKGHKICFIRMEGRNSRHSVKLSAPVVGILRFAGVVIEPPEGKWAKDRGIAVPHHSVSI